MEASILGSRVEGQAMHVSKHHPRSAAAAEAIIDADGVRTAISKLLLDAVTCLSPMRVAGTVHDLLERIDPASLDPDRQAALMADSVMMATTLLLFTPSSGGSTAVDRLVKQAGRADRRVRARGRGVLRLPGLGGEGGGGTSRYVFFGLPADVAAARYLCGLIDQAFAGETASSAAARPMTNYPPVFAARRPTPFSSALAAGSLPD